MSAPTVCLTFDDRFCQNWNDARGVFEACNIRATFCVHGLQEATDEELRILHDLQSDGHEIACHSQTHPRLASYLQAHGLDAWLKNEVLADQALHRQLGFPGTAFACPFHHITPEVSTACAALFTVTRGAGPLRPGTPDLSLRISKTLPSDRTLDNLGMLDMMHRAQGGWSWLGTTLDAVAEQGGTAVFAGHDIRAERSGAGFYLTRRQLTRLCQAISRRGLAAKTLSQAADLLTAPAASVPAST